MTQQVEEMEQLLNVNENINSANMQEIKEDIKKDDEKVDTSLEKADTPAQLVQQLHEQIEKLRLENPQQRVVLLCVDSSKASNHAAEWASKHCLQENDIIILLTVWEDKIDVSSFAYMGAAHGIPVLPISMIDSKEIYRNNKRHLDGAKHLLRSMYEHYFKNNHHVLSLLVGSHANDNDSIGQIIVNASEKLNTDLIIIGSRGLGAVEKFFMGSVSKYVISHCRAPVLLVKN